MSPASFWRASCVNDVVHVVSTELLLSLSTLPQPGVAAWYGGVGGIAGS
jgi:hypothetical protein